MDVENVNCRNARKKKKRIKAFEIWCYGRILKIKKVLKIIGDEKEIWNTIVGKRVRMIGYSLRYPEMLILILEEIVEGKNWINCKKKLINDTGCKFLFFDGKVENVAN